VERARPQVETLLLKRERFGRLVDPFLILSTCTDSAPREGPLAGILTRSEEPDGRGFDHVASFACDTPFFRTIRVGAADARASDFIGRFRHRAISAGTAHRVFALWPVACRDQLDAAFAQGARSMREVEELGWCRLGRNSRRKMVQTATPSSHQARTPISKRRNGGSRAPTDTVQHDVNRGRAGWCFPPRAHCAWGGAPHRPREARARG